MTQTILKALMRLFAIVAHVYDSENIAAQKKIVESYLRLYVRDKEVYQYTMMFNFYLKSLKQKDTKITDKKISLYSVKTLLIAEEINEILVKKQKEIILLFLIDIAYLEIKNRGKDKEFLRTISNALKIINSDFENTLLFVMDKYEDILNSKKILLVSNNPEPHLKHQIIEENLSGKIVVLQYRSTNTYVFRYMGEDDNLNLNNREIEPKRSYIFEKGSAIQNLKIKGIYYSDIVSHFLSDETLQDFSLSALDIEFYFNNSSNGIQKMNFNANSGQLIGIMGGSGVGKSTFLNVMNGSLKPNNGKILVNGYDIHEEAGKIEGLIGFIPQDDLLIEELTVYQNLFYNARLCFKDMSVTDIDILVNKTLKDLGLYKIKDLTVGSPLRKFISGGQRKRLNIALELIREPFILLVDEPTSGLSSHDSENVMELFKEQALKGKIVIVNIHQPSSTIFKQFDKLLVFDQGGRPVYFGNPVNSVVYFKNMSHLINANESECLTCGNVNPEQILEIIEAKNVNDHGRYTDIRKVEPEEWYTSYKKNIESGIDVSTTKKDLPKNKFQIPDKIKQFRIFSLRNILTKISDKQYIYLNLLEAPILAIILGFFTKYVIGTADNQHQYIFGENENIPSYIFMCIIVALFLGMMVSAEEIFRDRKILKRESFLNLSWNSYLNSKIVVLFAISAIQTLLFVFLGNIILGVRGMFLFYWIVLFSTSCFANMLGLIISASLKSIVSIYITIPLLLVPQLLFAGVIVKFDKLHWSVTSQEVVPVIGDIMVSRWSYEALAVTQFKKNGFQKHYYNVDKEISEFSYMFNYHIPEVITKTIFCKKYQDDPDYRSLVSKELVMIHFEIAKLLERFNDIGFDYLGSLTISTFNNEVAQITIRYLGDVKRRFSKLYEERVYEKDKMISEMIDNLGGKDQFFEFKQKYHNDALADQVLNKMERDKIIENNNKLIQKYEPIYKYPEKNNGRAQFYAPVKQFLGIYIDTLYFNLMVIWLMTFLFYLMLQYNTLKKILDSLQRIKIRLPDFKS